MDCKQVDIVAEIYKGVSRLVTGLMSRTFWGLTIVTYLYIKNIINLEQYQWTSTIIAGGLSVPKVLDIAGAITGKKAIMKVVGQVIAEAEEKHAIAPPTQSTEASTAPKTGV